EVGQVDNVVRNAKRLRALRIRVEARRVDDDAPAYLLAVAGFQLQIRVEAAAFAARDLVDLLADVVERKARVAVEREGRQHLRRAVTSVADHRELVVDGLVAGR